LNLLIVTFDPPRNIGGVEGRVEGYVVELERTGDKVVVEALSTGADFGRGYFKGAPYYTCPSSLVRTPEAIRFTGSILRRHSIDALFILSGGSTPFGCVLLTECRLLGLPTLVFFYGRDILQMKSSPLHYSLWVASQFLAGRTLVNSRFTRSLLPMLLRYKSRVLYPSVNPDFGGSFSQSNDGEGGSLLFVGRLVERKGLDVLLQALRLIAPDHPGVTLDVVGDGPEQSNIRRTAERLGLLDKVRFHGSLTGEPLQRKYGECDVLVMPSKTLKGDVEGFGTVFLEAGWFSKPCVGTRSGGIPEAVVDGVTGLLVDEGSVEQLTDALLRLISDQSLRRKMGEAARKRVLKKFTWQVTADQLRSFVYDQD
jgi:phosphatidyl-myo-inositol dimannoside synthase